MPKVHYAISYVDPEDWAGRRTMYYVTYATLAEARNAKACLNFLDKMKDVLIHEICIPEGMDA